MKRLPIDYDKIIDDEAEEYDEEFRTLIPTRHREMGCAPRVKYRVCAKCGFRSTHTSQSFYCWPCIENEKERVQRELLIYGNDED